MNPEEFFKENNKVALAFSGGTDSSYLLYEAAKAGADVTAYYVRSQFQPQFEYDDAVEVVNWVNERLVNKEGSAAGTINIKFKTIDLDILAIPEVRNNGENRCYYCKRAILTAILKEIESEQGAEHGAGGDVERTTQGDGEDAKGAEHGAGGNVERADANGNGQACILIDGNNASDVANDRPGMRATAELGVRSPLRELGITKDQVRELSEQAGLPTARKPAYACLATRVRTGEPITPCKLAVTEAAEKALHEMGFRDFRIRMRDIKTASDNETVETTASQSSTDDPREITEQSQLLGTVQIRPEQSQLLYGRRDEIVEKLSKYYTDLSFEYRV